MLSLVEIVGFTVAEEGGLLGDDEECGCATGGSFCYVLCVMCYLLCVCCVVIIVLHNS